ncbi:hypothetical protein B2K_12950 [Paenibacillus mucilaginosus K02]|uniref:STAS/SEC14 domain-containing protein n=2 Tax=Paenibacillus mucilaginosus TaxID=61624 RepID=I0BGW9_9BACL|nr:hypothetical protein B2K_12950 [Paenibacillus mucilaginosus K02]
MMTVYSIKSPGGSLFPYYYKGGEIHCLKYGSFYSDHDGLLSLMKLEEAFVAESRRRLEIWVDLYQTDLPDRVLDEFTASIGRMIPYIAKLAIVGCSTAVKWKLAGRLKRTEGVSALPLWFFSDPEEAKTWLVGERR